MSDNALQNQQPAASGDHAVAEKQSHSPQIAGESGALINMIERAATNPDVDIDKLERMFQLYKEQQSRQAEMAYNAALARLQSKLPEIKENGEIKHNGKLISRYKKWEDISRAIKPCLSEEGFALSFRVNTGDQVHVRAVLAHESGHSEDTTIALPADTSGSKNPVQAVASSVSYGKRYTAESLLNITSPGQDDDAQSAYAPAVASSPKRDALVKKLSDAADAGNDAFMSEWKKLSREGRETVGRDEYNALKHTAQGVQ